MAPSFHSSGSTTGLSATGARRKTQYTAAAKIFLTNSPYCPLKRKSAVYLLFGMHAGGGQLARRAREDQNDNQYDPPCDAHCPYKLRRIGGARGGEQADERRISGTRPACRVRDESENRKPQGKRAEGA